MKLSRKEFYKLVANESGGYYQQTVKDVCDAAQRVIEELMSNATKDDPVEIKIFEGLTLYTKYYSPRKSMNPRTGEKIMTNAHIYPQAKFTQAFSTKVREACDENVMEDGE